ncbi:transmembrane protease serine 3 [Electrophorus electricus]|uniref:transmembrane protease serine 3 n=1 Tax=Electrophorus electricus TaxID=8005 RepID=UPI0015D04CEA|nr:transmembrane protease serine 3 [Electrophorus electricus]
MTECYPPDQVSQFDLVKGRTKTFLWLLRLPSPCCATGCLAVDGFWTWRYKGDRETIVTPEKKAGENDMATPKGQNTEAKEEAELGHFKEEMANEEDLPTMDTPTVFNISPFSSLQGSGLPQDLGPSAQDPHVPSEAFAPLPKYKAHALHAPHGRRMSIVKVQPFVHGEDLSDAKSLCWPYIPRRLLALLIVFCAFIAVTLVVGIGLGVGLSCSGKFQCVSSTQCISRSALCDGVQDCSQGEDELNCVRVSGRHSILQLSRGGVWRSVCWQNWNPSLGLSACTQLGYTSYVNSSSIPLSSVESAFQKDTVTLDPHLPVPQPSLKAHNSSSLRSVQCISGLVTALKCIECGIRPGLRSRIVRGNMSVSGQFPWQASLQYQSQYICGGSVITKQWIVTAAHCVYGFASPSLWSVRVGISEQPVSGAGDLAVAKVLYHAAYHPERVQYDIALVRLAQPLTFSGQVQPICLPNYGQDFRPGSVCWVSGWGATQSGGEVSSSLQSATVPLLSARQCARHGLSSWSVCAGYLKGGSDTCQGDSGSPLACEDSVWKLVGVASWSQGCGGRNNPGIYTSIIQALPWIQQNMEKEEEQMV